MGKKKHVCKLCHVKKPLWKAFGFFYTRCRVCGNHLLVLADHRDTLTQVEQELVVVIRKMLFDTKWLRPVSGCGCVSTSHWSQHFARRG